MATTIAHVPTEPAEAAVRSPFTAVFSGQENGAIAITGNSQMSCSTTVTTCAAARAGTTNVSNNNFVMSVVDADTDSSTTNSTSADASLPSGSTVLYARLVWAARRTAGTGGVAAGGTPQNVRFRVPGGSYTTVTASSYVNPAISGSPYQASADVTSQVRAAGNGTYWVAGIAAATNSTDLYAGWSLAIAYRNPGAPLRDLRIIEGFADVVNSTGNQTVNIPISGFATPTSGSVNALIGAVAWEGDKSQTGDALRLNGVALNDAAHPATNFFDSAISDGGTSVAARNPAYANNLGVDVARVSANGVLPNGSTSTTLTLATTSDGYHAGLVTTQIDLLTPAFNPVSKTVVNLSGNDPAKVGDTLEYRISLTNSGADAADNSVIRDVLAPGITLVPGSIAVTASPSGANDGAKTDAVDSDIGEYVAADRSVRVRVGTGADGSAGGTLAPNASVSARFRATVDPAAAGTTVSNTAVLDYRARAIGTSHTFTGNSVTTPVQNSADLRIVKSSAPSSPVAGSDLTYTLTVVNDGPSDATNVAMVDPLPGGLTFQSAAPPAGTSCEATGQVVECTTPSLLDGDSAVVPITVTVEPGVAAGMVVNSATVEADTADPDLTDNTAADSTQVSSSANLSLAASGPADATAGTNVEYTLVATNDGPSTAMAVTIVNPLPAGTTYVGSTTTAGSCAVANGTVGCPLGDLDPGSSVTVTLTARVKSDVVDPSLENSATVSSATPDPDGTDNSAEVTTTLDQEADVAVTKTARSNPIVAGTVQTYTIRVKNDGPSDATAVTLSDPAVNGLNIRTATTTVGTCSVAGGGLTCPIGNLAAGTTAIVTVTADVAPDRPAGPMAGTASVTTGITDPDSDNDSATATVTVTTSADLSLSKTSDPSEITYGAPVTYTLAVTNAGPSVAGTVATSDTLPADFTFAGSTDGCTAVAAVVTCPLGDVAAGQTVEASFDVNTPASGSGDVTNTATVASADTPDPEPANDTASVESSAQQRADLTLTKATAPAEPVAGQQITYTLDVHNNGPSDATNVTLTDTLPSGVSFASGTSSGGATCTAAGGDVSCPLGTVADGADVTVTIVGNISPSTRGASTNTATVASAGVDDPSLGNNNAASSSDIQGSADKTVTLSAVQPFVTAGNEIDYVLGVSNIGPSTAQGVVVTGAVPPGLTPVLGSSGGVCSVSAGTVTCQFGTLPPGASLTVPLKARVDASTGAGAISGTAQIRSTTPDPTAVNNTDDAVFTALTSADLAVEKTVEPDPLVAGAPAVYEITVTNEGPSDAADVEVADLLDSALVPGSASPSLGSCDVTSQQVSCSVDRLTAGASMTVRVEAAVSPSASGSVTNTAAVSTATPDPDTGNDEATASIPVTTRADLRLTEVASSSAVPAGAAVTYTLNLTNAGPSDADDTTLTAPMPSPLAVLPAGLGATGDDCTIDTARTTVSCDFGTLPAGESRTVVVSALVPGSLPDGTTVTSTATASSPTAPAPVEASASFTSTVVSDLSITKAPVQDPPEAGTMQSYVISASNNGPSTAAGVHVNVELPDNSTYMAATASSGSCAEDGGVLTCDLGDLPQGVSPTIQLSVLVDAGSGGEELVNTSEVESAPDAGAPTPELNPSNDVSTVTQTIASRSSLTLEKEITGSALTAGDPVEYVLTVGNDGPSDADNMSVTDALAPGTTFSSATPSGDGTCSDATPVVCTWPSVPVGATRTVNLVADVPPDIAAGTVLTNEAAAASDSFNDQEGTDSATGTVTGSADLSIEKTISPDPAVPGDTVAFTLTARNDGPSTAEGVSVLDSLPPDLVDAEVTEPSDACDLTDGSAVSCTFDTLGPDEEQTVTITATLDPDVPAGTLANSASITSNTPDPDLANNSDTVGAPTAPADLVVTKTVDPATVEPGGPVSWTVTVTNEGPGTARSVLVADQLPDGITVDQVTIDVGTCGDAVPGETTVCTVGSIPADGTATITVDATVATDSTGTLTNSVAVTSPDESDGTDNAALVSSAVADAADLAITKTTTDSSVTAGEWITWEVDVVNNGPATASGVVVTDPLPAGVTLVSTDPACTVTHGALNCSLGALASDEAASVEIVGQVGESTRGSLANTATVASDILEPLPGNNSSTVTVDVIASDDETDAPEGASSGGHRGRLARTGFSSFEIAVSALALCAVGGTLVLIARRRPRADEAGR
jgi:uncharacterized repeat protein (TIGR01451 family)